MEESALNELVDEYLGFAAELDRREAAEKYNESRRRRRRTEGGPTYGLGIVHQGLFESEKTESLEKPSSSRRSADHFEGNRHHVDVNPQLCYAYEEQNGPGQFDEVERETRHKYFLEVVETIQKESQAALDQIASLIEKEVRKSKKWKERIIQEDLLWGEYIKTLIEIYITIHGRRSKSYCIMCGSSSTANIECSTCLQRLCHQCDWVTHRLQPFHSRTLQQDNQHTLLLPDQFLDSVGDINSKAVPLPCIVPDACQHCLGIGTLRLEPSSKKMVVITMEGRFDLNRPVFKCRNKSCPDIEATPADYMASGYFPGSLKWTYLFSIRLLKYWNHLRNLAPGTAECQFLKSIGQLGLEKGRSDIINRALFCRAFLQFQAIMHEVNRDVKKLDLAICLACHGDMVAGHADGIHKLYTFKPFSSKEGKHVDIHNPDSVMGDAVIAYEQEVEDHIRTINEKHPPQKEKPGNCGESQWTAMRADSSKFKGLEVTGSVVTTCRHGTVICACNMYEGESFRHTHLMMYRMWKMGCKFICNDVVCQFFPFAVELAKKFPEGHDFRKMVDETTGMKPFLSRMHAYAHSWYCQYLFNGHWQAGAGATTGEMMEQAFSYFYRFGNSTKHMTPARRRDVLTLAMFYHNQEKANKTPAMLLKFLDRAEQRVEQYKAELREILAAEGWTETVLPEMKQELQTAAQEAKNAAKTKSTVSLTLEQQNIEGHHGALMTAEKKLKTLPTSSKTRKKYQKTRNDLKKKTSSLIEDYNATHKDLAEDQHITAKHFEDGIFPWSVASEKTFQKKYRAVNTWMLLNRNKEETLIVEREMSQFLKNIYEKCTELDRTAAADEAQSMMEQQKEPADSGRSSFFRGRAIIARQEIVRLRQLREKAALYFSESRNDILNFIDEVVEDQESSSHSDTPSSDEDDEMEEGEEVEEEFFPADAHD